MLPVHRALGALVAAAVLVAACAATPPPSPSAGQPAPTTLASVPPTTAGGSPDDPTPAPTEQPPTAMTPSAPAATASAHATSPPSPGPTVDPDAASQILPGSVDRTSLNLRATYDVSARLSFATRAFSARTTLVVTNTSGGPIDRLELNTIAARLGSMHLLTVTVDGRAVARSVRDQTITVQLGGILPAGASATVQVPFTSRLRSSTANSDWMFTKANGIASIHRWIPWISKPTPFVRPNHGDPFVTPISPRVVVRLTTDRFLRVAGTGERVSISADHRLQTFRAEQVRDFVFSAAPDYQVHETTAGSHTIRVATRPGTAWSTMLSAAKNALTKLESRLGAYPYRLFTVAQSAGGFGMEGPMTVWIPFGVGASNLRYLVTHETGHQWFYGVVGNDQAREPFADEAATDFAARFILGLKRAPRCSADTLDRSIYQYTETCYYETIYIQGGNLLDSLRQRMGDTAFWRALKGYVADHRFGLAGTTWLLDALDDGTSLSFSSTYKVRFPRLY
jgi:hypothetical protein